MPDKKKTKQQKVIGAFFLITGVALILTFVFYYIGDSYVSGEYKGFFFTGMVAIFVGLFLILLKGYKTLYTIIASLTVLLAFSVIMKIDYNPEILIEEVITHQDIEDARHFRGSDSQLLELDRIYFESLDIDELRSQRQIIEMEISEMERDYEMSENREHLDSVLNIRRNNIYQINNLIEGSMSVDSID